MTNGILRLKHNYNILKEVGITKENVQDAWLLDCNHGEATGIWRKIAWNEHIRVAELDAAEPLVVKLDNADTPFD